MTDALVAARRADTRPVFRLTPLAWVLLSVASIASVLAVKTGLAQMLGWLLTQPEYSHGLIIPFIATFLVWQRRDQVERMPFPGSWAGLLLALVGAMVGFIGKMSALFTIEHYSLLIMLYGVLLALTGWRVFRLLWVPLLILIFMVPLPAFLYFNLSAQLQLLSSQIGVWFIRLLGISVYLEGNVIDLGVYRLQVAEACSGLRYLFPLMTIGFLIAYFFKTAFWKRALLFLSSIPITILMNSFRIGMIGVMVEHWGVSHGRRLRARISGLGGVHGERRAHGPRNDGTGAYRPRTKTLERAIWAGISSAYADDPAQPCAAPCRPVSMGSAALLVIVAGVSLMSA